MKFCVKDRNRVPYGGMYRARHPESGILLREPGYESLEKAMKEHCRANNYPIGLEFDNQLEDWVCKEMPDECEPCKGDLPMRPRQIHMDDVLRGMTAIAGIIGARIKQLFGGDSPFVSQEEAERRAAICSKCIYNVKFKTPCSGVCPELRQLIGLIRGSRSTPYDNDLMACGVCGCATSTSVWVRMDIQDKALTPQMRDVFGKIDYCWKKDLRERNAMAYGNTSWLKSLNPPDATVPATRMSDAASVQDLVRQLVFNDAQRAYKRSRTLGLDDGFPPYHTSKLRELGRPDACNVNWGTARSHRESAQGILFDLFSESPTYMTVQTGYGTQDEREEWSRIITEEVDKPFRKDSRWNYVVQNSQKFTVLNGVGPLFFEDNYCPMPRFIPTGDLKVPEAAKSDTAYWEFASIVMDYLPHELFAFIKDPVSAQKVGWRVPYTKRCIMSALPKERLSGITLDWEWAQEQFKKNSFNSYFDSQVIRVAHCFWKEFDGRITHAIVEQETQTPTTDKTTGGTEYLYINVGRFKDWKNVIHPMYYDLGNGTHYTVTGMGVKMYGALTYENRLLCNLADKAFSPKLLFKPTSTSAAQKVGMIPKGDYGVLTEQTDVVQTGVAGLMNDGLAMHNVLTNVVANNLAAYTQSWNQHQGNPPTARQVMIEAQNQSRIGATQISRYYEQLDCLYQEIYRRMSDLNSPDQMARDFQKRCIARGVPKAAIAKVDKVEATRVAGQGSKSLRQVSLQSVMGILARLPETGQEQVVSDYIASFVGQSGVERYYPRKSKNQMPNDQEADAMQWVGAMKEGVPPVITSSQNPVIYAVTWLSAAAQAVGSVPKGGDPVKVLQFVETVAPAALAQMNRFANDPTRQQVYKELMQQFKQLSQIHDQLKAKVSQAMAKNNGGNGGGQGQLPPDAIAKIQTAKILATQKAQNMAQSHQQRMRQRDEIHKQNMADRQRDAQLDTAIKDLETASELQRNRLKSFQE